MLKRSCKLSTDNFLIKSILSEVELWSTCNMWAKMLP